MIAPQFVVPDVVVAAEYYRDFLGFRIWVNDLDPLYAELRERGAKIVEPPTTQIYKCYEMVVEDGFGFRLAFGMPVSSQPDVATRS
jgi:hypothetical protein